jgi:hypothetical protein
VGAVHDHERHGEEDERPRTDRTRRVVVFVRAGETYELGGSQSNGTPCVRDLSADSLASRVHENRQRDNYLFVIAL